MYAGASPAQKHRPECSGQSGQRALVHVLYLIVDVQYSAERSAAALVHALYLMSVCMNRMRIVTGMNRTHCLCMLTPIDMRLDVQYSAERSEASLVHCVVPNESLYEPDADSDGHGQDTLLLHAHAHRCAT